MSSDSGNINANTTGARDVVMHHTVEHMRSENVRLWRAGLERFPGVWSAVYGRIINAWDGQCKVYDTPAMYLRLLAAYELCEYIANLPGVGSEPIPLPKVTAAIDTAMAGAGGLTEEMRVVLAEINSELLPPQTEIEAIVNHPDWGLR